MNKKIKIIFSVFLIILFIVGVNSNSYGLCNTATFSLDVSAVELILSNGQKRNDIRIIRQNSGVLTPINYKELSLIFVIETENGLTENKESMKGFIDNIYSLYGTSADKVHIGVISFEDIPNSTNPTSSNVMKNSRDDVIDAIDNIDENSNQSLEDALKIAVDNQMLNAGGAQNDQMLQYLVLMTDGILYEDICINSNPILKDMTEQRMVGLYAILIDIAKDDLVLKKLFDNIFGIAIASDISLNQVETQLNSDVYTYISDYVVRTNTIIPIAQDENSLITSDRVILTGNGDEVYGALLRIEYVMGAATAAIYGNGTISQNMIKDYKDEKLKFDKNEKLITDINKSNGDYGWDYEDDTKTTLVTNSSESEIRLVLTTYISNKNIDEIYTNRAATGLTFNIGAGVDANYNLSARAMDVQILPNFGEEKTPSFNMNLVIGTSISVVAIMVLLIVTIKLIKRK